MTQQEYQQLREDKFNRMITNAIRTSDEMVAIVEAAKKEQAIEFGFWLLFSPHQRVSASDCDDMFWEFKNERFTTDEMYDQFIQWKNNGT